MAETLKLSILSPSRRLVDRAEVESVTVASGEGEIQILPGHAPLVSTLQTGTFSYTVPGGRGQSGFISTGFLEVAPNDEVIVLAETLELAGEIDLIRAKEAQKKAEATLREAELDEHSFKKYQLKLQRSVIRQQIGETR